MTGAPRKAQRRPFRAAAAALPLAALPFAAGLALASPAWAQGSGEEASFEQVQAEFSEAFEAIGQYTAEERDEALAALDSTLERLDDRIEELQQRAMDEWSQMSEASREQTSEALRDLRERRNRLSEAYGALSQGTGTAWDDLIGGVRNGWSDLSQAWDDATAALGPDSETQE